MISEHWRLAAAGAVAVAVACTALTWRVAAQPGASAADKKVEGRVTDFMKNDHGDVDAMKLKNGKVVHFPPHIGDRVTKAIKVGDDVTVRGREETRPEGDTVLEASSIESGTTTIKVEPPHPPRGDRPGPPRPEPREDEPAMNAKGAVRSMSTNPHGDVDGFTLEDGTEVKFPPHQSAELARLVKEGTKVQVDGRRHKTPRGDVHLHADVITVADTGKSLRRDEPAGPPPPPRVHGAGGPRGPADEDTAVKLDDILREVREIHRLLDHQQQR